MASDKTNIAFRTQIQSGCIGIKDELAKEKKTSDFDHIRQELGMKPEQQQKQKSDDDIKEEYLVPYRLAVKSLFENQLNASQARLLKKDCAAILTHGFCELTCHGSKGLEELRDMVTRKIAAKVDENENKVPVF